MSFCVLGSGSGGNCAVLRVGGQAVFIDAGLGPRVTAARLEGSGLGPSGIGAVCLTHLDQDHFRPAWVRVWLSRGTAVWMHRWHLEDLGHVPGARRLLQAGLVHCFEDETFEPLGGLACHPIRLAHDEKGTSGFRVEAHGATVGYATDLGHVPDRLIAHFTGVDLLAIESNYDPELQRGSGRPLFLQRRIMGRAGHLSNEQAFDAVRRIVERSPAGRPRNVVLLHPSARCNRPALTRAVFDRDPAIAARLLLAEQRRRTPWLTVGSKGELTGPQMFLRF